MPAASAAAFAVHHKLWVAGLTGPKPAPGHGALYGHQYQPREIARACYDAGWQDAQALWVTVAVVLAESQGYSEAIHVNLDGSEDLGPFQLDSIHGWPASDATDLDKAAAHAFTLYTSRGGWEDWAAYNTDVYLHDSYLGKATAGVANYLGEYFLAQPVKPWAGKEYTHRFKTPVVNFQHRLSGCLNHLEDGADKLGWQAAPAPRVKAVREELARGKTAAYQPLPN